MKKITVFYYTQSGQALKVAQSLCQPMHTDDSNYCVVYKPICPVQEFPFPWTKDAFFEVFPETRLGIPITDIHEIDLSDVQDSELVMIVGQSWFLSPSMPLQAFFANDHIKRYLHGRRVVFVNVCRNMWVSTKDKVRDYLNSVGAQWVGHIVLQDENPNLVSVFTILRWMFYGKKQPTKLLPAAGVADADIAQAARFGDLIKAAMASGEYSGLQQRLVQAGAIHYKPSILFMERTGHRMFGFWAPFIRRKGDYGNPKRHTRCMLFMVYLMFVLYVVSPIGILPFHVVSLFRKSDKQQRADCLELQ